jgi:hypothetical protein
MGNETKTVIGIERGVNKKYNTPFTILHTMTEFNDYEKNNRGAQGNKCESTYIRGNISVAVGDIVKFVYVKGFNNEAVVSDVEIIA